MIFINKLPEIFKKNIDSKHINNIGISYIRKDISYNKSKKDIIRDIDELFKKYKYVFNVGVIIKTNNEIYDTKIIGRNDNSLLTVDDKVIYFKDIVDFNVKDRY